MKIKKILYIISCLILVSCSQPRNLAYEYVANTKGATVALYVPSELVKLNLRSDCQEEALDTLSDDEAKTIIDARTQIVNKIDDELFLDVLIASFEETMNDYGVSLTYWENDKTSPDSLHWIVDLSHIEIQEVVDNVMTDCGFENFYGVVPATRVNVASWFELSNSDKSHMLFTEQNYYEHIIDCTHSHDSTGRAVLKAELDHLTINGFYDFAVMLGKLYAGYSYDFFMNEYVRKEMIRKEKYYNDEYMYMRYDPYVSYIYYSGGDKLIPVGN